MYLCVCVCMHENVYHAYRLTYWYIFDICTYIQFGTHKVHTADADGFIFVYMHSCLQIHTYMHTHIYTYIQFGTQKVHTADADRFMFVYMCSYTNTYIHTRTHICIHTKYIQLMLTGIYALIYANKYINTYTHIYIHTVWHPQSTYS